MKKLFFIVTFILAACATDQPLHTKEQTDYLLQQFNSLVDKAAKKEITWLQASQQYQAEYRALSRLPIQIGSPLDVFFSDMRFIALSLDSGKLSLEEAAELLKRKEIEMHQKIAQIEDEQARRRGGAAMTLGAFLLQYQQNQNAIMQQQRMMDRPVICNTSGGYGMSTTVCQ